MLMYILLGVCVAMVVGQPGVDPNDPCRDCRMYNGVGFKGHATQCNLFYQCTWNRGRTGYVAELRRCPCGLFWSQAILTCIFSGDINCPTNPCTDPNIPNYPDPDNCKSYFMCEGGRTVSQVCCGTGERYDIAARGCVPDTQNPCTDDCPCVAEATTGTAPACDFLPVAGEPEFYIWVYPNGRSKMRCPRGTNFNVASCKCDLFVPATRVLLCDTRRNKRDVSPQVDEDIRDVIWYYERDQCAFMPPVTGHNQSVLDCLTLSISYQIAEIIDVAEGAWIENFKVSVNVAGTGIYDGSSYLNIPRFANVDWKKIFGLEFAFTAKMSENADGPLFDNCDCDEPSTISLRLGSRVDTSQTPSVTIPTVFLTMITADGTHNLQVLYNDDVLNTVKVAYSSGSIYLATFNAAGVVLDTATQAANGKILNCQCGAKIGYAWENRYFKGSMSKNNLYKECLPINFIQP